MRDCTAVSGADVPHPVGLEPLTRVEATVGVPLDVGVPHGHRLVVPGPAGGKDLVFGNSGGAIAGLDLAARHPGVITGLIAHEPPAVRVLPKDDPWRHFFDRIGKR
jgi:hypothetical protein